MSYQSIYRQIRIVGVACMGLPLCAVAAEFDHLHVATSSVSESVKWYVAQLDCTADLERPKVVTCGKMDIEFVARPSIGGSQGTGINHISISFADVTAKMNQLEAVGVAGSGVRLQRFDDGSTLQTTPGLGKHGFIFDPWGTRIELVEDPAMLGFHHVHLQSVDPKATLEWYANVFDGEAAQFNGTLPGLRFDGVWLFVEEYTEGTPAPTPERAIDHLSFVLTNLDDAAIRMRDQGVDVQTPVLPEGARSPARRAFLAGPDGVLIAVVETGWAGVEDVEPEARDTAVTTVYPVPMTPWGEPDMQGVWTGNAAHGIPLERPEEEASDSLTTQEAAARRERGTLGSIWGYEREWRDTTLGYDKLAPSTQVAMIIDPPNGRMPAMTLRGQEIAAATLETRTNRPLAAGPEDLSNYVRCITRGLPSMMMPGVYNNGLQIVQSPGYVAIQKEMIHETRVIPTTPKPALDGRIKQWLGSSRGHWEGDTLVVEVKGFNGKETYQGAGENLTLTERYRRVGPDTLEYSFTVDDPTIWVAPWTGMFNFKKDDSQYELVEYACHEGNYGMTNILSGARSKERQMNEAGGN